MTESPNWPPSDAGFTLRTKFRLWIAAIVADEARQAEEARVEGALDGNDAGVDYPERPPAGMDPDSGYDPLPF